MVSILQVASAFIADDDFLQVASAFIADDDFLQVASAFIADDDFPPSVNEGATEVFGPMLSALCVL